ncbi:uncharacterized protein HMF8227_01847 [Saliniradius amylolyticus]|uniref:Cell division coordinator CpoB n=1 Tax=Saliniradius amylolyticus TaxID=2183582 RepID=A0A2S2E5S7_9ALTE|nr:tol-pal system protein YbgF [Saliniradius amylolyticus]AWL12317.1 uncharacterized protein HMF8227_01847 [Saliniradius amylolyticus]
MLKRSLMTVSFMLSGAAVCAAPAPVTDVNSQPLEERVATLERIVNSRTGTQQRMQQRLDELQNEVNELRGSVEVHSHKLEQILERQRELYLEIDKRIQEVTQRQQEPSQPLVSEPTASSTAAPQSEDQAYDHAVNLILKEKRYDDAIPEFKAFLSNYPDSEYAPNAHYWLGQLLFNQQQWSESENHFERVVNGFPESSKRADSMLKLAMIAQNQSNLAKARQLFEQVSSEYPDSSAANLAKSRLQSLK